MNPKAYPKLRFKEFTDEWKEKKLGEVCVFQQGVQVPLEKQYQKESHDLVKFLRIENYTQGSTEYRFIPKILASGKSIDQTEVAVVRYGATAGFIARGLDGVLANNLFKVSPNKELLKNGFVYLQLNSDKVFKYLQTEMAGGAMPALSFSTMKNLYITFPRLLEQEKIADFLTAVDEEISFLEAKREQWKKYKKGVMQAIFSQKIRFKKDDGSNYPDWEDKRLGELLDYEQPTKYIIESTEYSDSFKIPVLTAGKSFILGYTNEDKNVFVNLPVIIFDDFTTTSQFVTFPFKVKSSAIKILKSKDDANIRFIFEVMQTIRYEVGGHGRHWISVFSNIKISIPSKKEQEKIANFLASLDSKIDLINNELEQMKLFKKSLLQQMFV